MATLTSIPANDPDGLLTYEYIANHIDEPDIDIDAAISNMIRVDLIGQFTASAARYLHAIDAQRYATQIETLVSATIDKDRDRAFLSDLLVAIYGDDYQQHATQLCASDRNFRRIYQRLFPTNII